MKGSLREFWVSWGPWKSSEQETVSGSWESQALLQGSELLICGYDITRNTVCPSEDFCILPHTVSVFTQRKFKGSVFSSLLPLTTIPNPTLRTSLPSHSLKVLGKPPNFMIEINVFIRLQMLELNTHTSRVNTSPFGFFSQVIRLFLFFFFFHYPFNAEQGYWLQRGSLTPAIGLLH